MQDTEATDDSGEKKSLILIVDDDPVVCRLYHYMLKQPAGQPSRQIDTALTFADAAALIARNDYHAIILDISLGDRDGLAFLAESTRIHPETPVILVTGQPDVETAVAAVRSHAYDYLIKPVSTEKLASTVARAVQLKTLRDEKKRVEIENLNHRHHIRDISTLKQAEEQIRNQNAFLHSVIEALGHPLMVIDAADYTVKIANAAARQINGTDAGKTCHAIIHHQNTPCDEKDACPLAEVLRTRRPVAMVHTHTAEPGKRVDHEVRAFPIFDSSGNIIQIIQYYIDITEKRRLESIAEAVNLMDNLGYIFSGIRHEIGNPINSVKMALSVLSMNLDTYPRKTIREFVDRSLSELARVEYLLKAFKNFSLFETPDVVPTSIQGFMVNFKSLVESDFRKKGVRIQLMLPKTDVMVMTDPRAFHQVMLNLTVNAVDALNGRDMPTITIAVTEKKDSVIVRISDNGIGMTEKELSDLFKPFFTTKAKGTGLGLVIVRKMLAKMHSMIHVDSAPNRGTVVTLTLPGVVSFESSGDQRV
ncbi:response regulator [Desulfosarcina sp. OttesenSCG-928-B08]|nr:response regulator [Desulfosarcina sp. OttesenSCG-928-B08]